MTTQKPSRIIVCGGRDFKDRQTVFDVLDWAVENLFDDQFVIIEGDANGADRYAGAWARIYGYPLIVMPAHWDSHLGKKAGKERNTWMLNWADADYCIAFPGGTGTDDMINKSRNIWKIPVWRPLKT